MRRIIVGLICLVAVSCSKEDYPTNIIGNWKADFYHVKLQAVGESSDKEKIEIPLTMDIKADGTAVVVFLTSKSATWSLSEDYEELNLTYVGGTSEVWEVKKLTEKKMRIEYTATFPTGTATQIFKLTKI